MPTLKQINDISGGTSGSATYTSNFSPVHGGFYSNGPLNRESTSGIWWGSTAYDGAGRYRLDYYGSNLYTSSGVRRFNGYYIRCVSEEKDVSDLTYMQDMMWSRSCYFELLDGGEGVSNDIAVINGEDNQHKGAFFFGNWTATAGNNPKKGG